MKIYKAGATGITLAGQAFSADGDGIIDVPDHLASNAFHQGFVSAKGRMRELQAVAKAAVTLPMTAEAQEGRRDQSPKTKPTPTDKPVTTDNAN